MDSIIGLRIRAAVRAASSAASLVAGLLLFSASVHAKISLVRVTTCGPTSFPTTCSIPATAAGNLLAVAWQSNFGGGNANIARVTDNAGNSYEPTGARSADSNTNTMSDIWYAKDLKSGATSITLTPSPSGTTGTMVVWEFTGLDRSSPLDRAAALNTQGATSSPSGAPVALSSGAGAIVSIINVQETITGIAAGNSFSNDSNVNGNGWAHMIGSSAGTYQAQWAQSPAGTYGSSTVSFRAGTTSGGGGGTALNACDLTSDGAVNSLDVNSAVSMTLGLTSCTAEITSPGVCDAVTVQRVINAALQGTCVTGSGSPNPNPNPAPHSVTLTWTASTSSGVTGYNIYRSTSNGGPYVKINSAPVSSLNYVDNNVSAGQTYYYVATATSSSSESGYSSAVQAVIPAQ